MPPPGYVTQWLHRLQEGDEEALERLVPMLYDELRQMARFHLNRERADHTLNPTGLVNEVYLKLIQRGEIHADHRAQFLAVASHTMRRFLIDYARKKKRIKRGGGQANLPLEEARFLTDDQADEALALDEALNRLAEINPRGSQVVQYRFFSGLTLEETADLMGVSTKTVQRAWVSARAWLRKEIAHDLGF